jgi:hypothetical protein
MEEMLAKSESLIKHHDSIIKQQAENYKELQAKVTRKNKKIDELKEITPQKNMPSN